MKSMYPADENGNLIYWMTECGEKKSANIRTGTPKQPTNKKPNYITNRRHLPPL